MGPVRSSPQFRPETSCDASVREGRGGVIGIFGGGAAAAFALLNGAGNGILTIACGTLPLAIFGPENYAYRLGLIGAPSRIAQALAPLGSDCC
jgi:hypothetical protein